MASLATLVSQSANLLNSLVMCLNYTLAPNLFLHAATYLTAKNRFCLPGRACRVQKPITSCESPNTMMP